jgi:hypothetical protein
MRPLNQYPCGIAASFKDLYGDLWDLLQQTVVKTLG